MLAWINPTVLLLESNVEMLVSDGVGLTFAAAVIGD